MAFAVRFISTTAAGREIVRASEVAGNELTVGRGTDNQVVLADLAAAPTHARLIDAGDRVLIESIGGEPVMIDGKPRQSCEVRLDRPAVIGIGAYRLHFARAADGAVDLVIRREDAAPAPDERRAFALAGRLPGKRPMAWAAVVAVLALFLVWPIWSFAHKTINPRIDTSWSAGTLSPGHAGLAHNCKACHVGAFVAVKDTTCKSCHASVHDHADPARMAAAEKSIGGMAMIGRRISAAFGRPSGRCSDCHVEHRGAQAMASSDQRFCSDCHATLHDRLTDTRLGDAGDFAKVHPQFEPVVATSPEHGPVLKRVSLDDHPQETNGLIFPHAMHLAKGGGVAKMAVSMGGGPLQCAGCHRAEPDGRGFAPVSMEKSCESCHSLAYARVGPTYLKLPHGDTAQSIAALTSHGGPGAVTAAFSRNGICADCHLIEPPGAGHAGYRVAPVRQPSRYLTRGWFDHDKHSQSKCTECHAAPASKSASDVLIPGIATCRNCHGGEHAAAPKVRSSCVLCHDYHHDTVAPATTRRKGGTPGATVSAALLLRVDWRS